MWREEPSRSHTLPVSTMYNCPMPNSADRANRELLAALVGLVRDLQERLNEVTLMSFAATETLALQDESFADLYLAKKDELENGEMGQRFASTLAGLNQLVDRMNADLN